MHSKLTNKIVLAHSNNYMVGRGGYKVCKITPHHMAGVLSAERCAQLFQKPNRIASANYCIGNDGQIVCNVDEVNRAFTSSNYINDCQAITIEVSNSQAGGNWPISQKAWDALVNLCVDICQRYGFRLNFTGDANGSLTMHKMFAATSCPGPYLESRMAELARTVNARLDGQSSSTTTPSGAQNGAYESYSGYVEVIYNGLTIRSKASWDDSAAAGTVKKGEVFTVVGRQKVGGVYLYKLKSGKWITSAPEYVKFRTTLHESGGSTTSNSLKDADGYYKVGTKVCTNTLATASTGGKVYKGDWKGTITRVIKGTPYPYLLNNGTGWTNNTGIDTDPHTP